MRLRVSMAAALAAVALLAGCGGESESAGATTKEEWEEEHGELVAAYSRDLTAALNIINQGERTATMATCNQVTDDAKEVQQTALPVPDPAADGALRKAVDVGLKAAESCLAGARATQAHAIETSQKQFAEARAAMDEAEAAISAWK